MSTAIDKQKGAAKTARAFGKSAIPIVPVERLKKPDWIRVKAGGGARFLEIKQILRQHRLHTVCEEATCPNIGECFGKGTATFMILGDLCTRRCPFCDVAHGRPKPPDAAEPANLALTIAALGLRYVVITSVDRDDLRDGGAQHLLPASARYASLRRHPHRSAGAGLPRPARDCARYAAACPPDDEP
jgi:lipoic acid synthetase